MTTDNEKPAPGTKCCARVHASGGYVRGHQCGKAAKVVRDGKPYCGLHDPVAVKERRAKSYAEWKEREAAKSAASAKAEAARAEMARRAGCFDDLLAALEELLAHAAFVGIAPHYDQMAQAAIAKARGRE